MSLALVQRLRRLQRRVGRQPVPPVHVPLELGQVVELRRLDSLRLAFDAQDLRRDVLARAAAAAWASSSLAKRSPANLKVTSRYRVSSSQNGSGLKRADLVVAADDHGQHRRLHPADAPEQAAGAVADGVVAGRVQADDPVGLAAAAGRGVERVVVGQRPESAERRRGSPLGQRAEPQPPRRFARAAGQLQDVAEDQLTLAAGIGGADQLIGGAEEAADDRELLARLPSRRAA